ncbi:hypothetical protein, partial [Hymenobacter coccineus]|uniref:hypothetical protein n=1 Tax=Hymenobacter coccineus TaxID=1908235 RepID=UPI0013016ECB
RAPGRPGPWQQTLQDLREQLADVNPDHYDRQYDAPLGALHDFHAAAAEALAGPGPPRALAANAARPARAAGRR